jgi:hypothetical protein
MIAGYVSRNKLYAWSMKYNIVFVEYNLAWATILSFGRPQELSVFLLSWDAGDGQPRAIYD